MQSTKTYCSFNFKLVRNVLMNVMLIKDTIGKSNSNITLWVEVIIINLWIFEMLLLKKIPFVLTKVNFLLSISLL